MRNSLSDNRNLFKNQYFFTTKKWSRVHTAATIWRQVEDDDGWLCADSGGGDCSPSTPGVYRTDSWTAARSYLWVAVALPQRFCFNYTVERGLVIGFCSQPHYCCRPYYPTARFQSPLSYVVLMNSFRTGQGRHRANFTNGVSSNHLPVILASVRPWTTLTTRTHWQNFKVDWIYSTKQMMTQSYGWNLQWLQHSRNNNNDFCHASTHPVDGAGGIMFSGCSSICACLRTLLEAFLTSCLSSSGYLF